MVSPATQPKTESTTLKGKKVLVTGGTTGIGRAIAIALLNEGAEVLIFGRKKPELEDALKIMNEIGTIHGMNADQAKDEDVKNVFKEVDDKLGSLDILINNAAVSAKGVENESIEEIRYAIESNLIGYVQCAHLALERFESRGQIVNIGSMSNTGREAGASVYVATKAGINGFTESLRKEANKKGVRVTLIEPGSVGTDFGDTSPEEQRKLIDENKMLMAEDIARAVLFALMQPERSDIVSMQIRPHLQDGI